VIWGKVEVDKREVTLDDMWSIDLAKMNEFRLVQPLSEAAVEWMEDEADVDEEGDPPEGWVDSDDDGVLGEEPDSDEEVRRRCSKSYFLEFFFHSFFYLICSAPGSWSFE